MKVGLLHGLCWLMDEMLPHCHSQPRVTCAWLLLGFLLQKNVASLLAARGFSSVDFIFLNSLNFCNKLRG